MVIYTPNGKKIESAIFTATLTFDIKNPRDVKQIGKVLEANVQHQLSLAGPYCEEVVDCVCSGVSQVYDDDDYYTAFFDVFIFADLYLVESVKGLDYLIERMGVALNSVSCGDYDAICCDINLDSIHVGDEDIIKGNDLFRMMSP